MISNSENLERDAKTDLGHPSQGFEALDPMREGFDVLSSWKTARSRAIAVPVAYAVFGIVWILASDLLLESFHLGEFWTTRISLAKGWIFVGGSTILLSIVLRSAWGAIDSTFQRLQGELSARRKAQEVASRLAIELEERVEERTLHLQEAIGDLEMFTESLSHDFRAPVRAIAGFSAILVEDHDAEFGESAKVLVRRVTDSAARMDRMIEGLSALARCRRDRLALRMVSAAEHGEMVDGLWSELLMTHPGRAIDFRRGELGDVRADPRLLELLWRNLLSNSAKYTRGRDPALIEVESGDGWFVARDNGVGFDPARSEEMFRPFRRLHRADEFEGDGFGLALVRRIVERHDGRIEADSTIGSGAEFRFRFHVAEDRRP